MNVNFEGWANWPTALANKFLERRFDKWAKITNQMISVSDRHIDTDPVKDASLTMQFLFREVFKSKVDGLHLSQWEAFVLDTMTDEIDFKELGDRWVDRVMVF